MRVSNLYTVETRRALSKMLTLIEKTEKEIIRTKAKEIANVLQNRLKDLTNERNTFKAERIDYESILKDQQIWLDMCMVMGEIQAQLVCQYLFQNVKKTTVDGWIYFSKNQYIDLVEGYLHEFNLPEFDLVQNIQYVIDNYDSIRRTWNYSNSFNPKPQFPFKNVAISVDRCYGGNHEICLNITPKGFWSDAIKCKIKPHLFNHERVEISWSIGGWDKEPQDQARNFHRCLGLCLDLEGRSFDVRPLDAFYEKLDAEKKLQDEQRKAKADAEFQAEFDSLNLVEFTPEDRKVVMKKCLDKVKAEKLGEKVIPVYLKWYRKLDKVEVVFEYYGKKQVFLDRSLVSQKRFVEYGQNKSMFINKDVLKELLSC